MAPSVENLYLFIVALNVGITALVFFLLVTTASVDNLRNPRELSLPTSLSLDQPPTAAPVITLTKQAVLIQGEQVMTLEEAAAAPEGKPIPQLRAELLKVTLLQVQGATPGATTRGEINVMADKDIPYRLLRKLMGSCAAAGYGELQFAVRRKEAA